MEHQPIKEAFIKAMRRFGQLHLSTCFGNQLTKGEFFCLSILHHSGLEEGQSSGMHVSDLAQRLRVRPPAASRMLGALEQRGLVERCICPGDRRSITVTLTPAGLAAWQETAQTLDRFTDRVVAGMGAEEMQALVTLMDRLCTIMEEEREAMRSC